MSPELLRRMAYDDLGQVQVLERQSFPNPWPRGAFMHAMLAGYECWVVERGGKILAYGIMDLSRSESHLLNLCVLKRERRKGHAKRVLEYLAGLAAERTETMTLEVRASNLGAQNLYVKMGFRLSGIREGYYPAASGREDALVFKAAIGDIVGVSSSETS